MKISNSEIDAAIFACLCERYYQVKTAMIIGSVIMHFGSLASILEKMKLQIGFIT